MKKIIPINHIEKTYVNPIINQIVRSLCSGLAIPESFVVRQNFLNRNGVKDWNSGKLRLRPMEGNRDTIEFVANSADDNLLRGMELRAPSKSILQIPKYGIYLKPIRIKDYTEVTIKVTSISRSNIENLINALNYKKSISSVYVMEGIGSFHVSDYITNLLGEVNDILNKNRDIKKTNPEFIGENMVKNVRVATNLSGKTDGIIIEEKLSNISVNIHGETSINMEESVDTNVYSTTFVVTLDMSYPMAFELTTDNVIAGTPLPPPYNRVNLLVEHYENYAYYSELITQMVKDDDMEGEIITWNCINGTVQEGPFKGAFLDNNYEGALTGVYVNGTVYGGELDGFILAQTYFGNMGWSIIDGIVQDGDLKGTQLPAPNDTYTGIVNGVYVDGKIYGGKMHGLNVNGTFTVDAIDGIIQSGLFEDRAIEFPNVGFTGTLSYTLEDGKVLDGMLEGWHVSNLSYEIFSWSVDGSIILDGPFNGRDITEYVGENYFGSVKGEIRNFTVTEGVLIGLTNNGDFEYEVIDSKVVNGLLKDVYVPASNNNPFNGILTGHLQNGIIYGGLLDGFELDVEDFNLITIEVISGVIQNSEFKDYTVGIDYTGSFEAIISKRTIFSYLLDGLTLRPRLGGIVIDDIVVGGKMDGTYTPNHIEDFTFLKGRYEGRNYYDDDLGGNLLTTLEERVKTSNNVYDAYYDDMNLEFNLENPYRLINIPFYDRQSGYLVNDYQSTMSILLSIDSDNKRYGFNIGDLGLYSFADEFIDVLKMGDGKGLFERRRFPLLLEIYKDGERMSPGEFAFNQETLDITSVEDMDPNSTYRVFVFVLLNYDLLRYSFDYPWEEVFPIIDSYLNKLNILILDTSDGAVLVKAVNIEKSSLAKTYGWQTSVSVSMLKNKSLLLRI